MTLKLRVRSATPDDAQQLAALLNGIVEEGKTAIAEPFDATKVNEWFIVGAHCLGCIVAEASEGALVGFQALERFHHEELPPGMADIGTFIAPDARRKGVGCELTSMTVLRAASANITSLRAVIREDNLATQAFYRSCGFLALPEGSQSSHFHSQSHSHSTILFRTIGK